MSSSTPPPPPSSSSSSSSPSSTSSKMVAFMVLSSTSPESRSELFDRPTKKQKKEISDTDVYVPTFTGVSTSLSTSDYLFINNLFDKTPLKNLYLFDAIYMNNYNSIEEQLKYKTTNVNIIEKYDRYNTITPLQYAITKNDLEAVKLLLTRDDLLLNLTTPDTPKTALYMNKYAKINSFRILPNIMTNPNKKMIALEIEKLLLKGITVVKPLKYDIIRLLFIDHYRNKFTSSSSNDNNNNIVVNNDIGFNVLPMDIIKIIVEYCTIIDVQIGHE